MTTKAETPSLRERFLVLARTAWRRLGQGPVQDEIFPVHFSPDGNPP